MKVLTYILVIFFGSTAWLSTDAIWMQLPLLTDQLPEQWSLPSYLAIVVQLACVGPLIYSILLKWYKIKIPTASIILILLIFSCICLALLAFFWSNTFHVFGQNRSVVLMALMFGLALVNTSSSVLFMPYMAIFHPSYLTAYFIGMSFSALYPSTVSMIQGTGDECKYVNGTGIRIRVDPFFGFREFIFMMLAWMIVASVAFVLLNWTSLGKEDATSYTVQNPAEVLEGQKNSGNLSKFKRILFFAIIAFVNAQMNGIIPSSQSFAAMPYSQGTYRLSLTLANIVAPLACFLPLVLRTKSGKIVSSLTVLATFSTAYIVWLAAISPTPILHVSVPTTDELTSFCRSTPDK